ncbi:MAG: hypothetical protein WD063_01640 [Pirellulales bacterium]
MHSRLVRHGDGLALVLDRSILDELQVDENTPLEVTTYGRTLVVAPVADEEHRRRFARAMDSVNKRYADVFRRLAE